MIYFFIYLILSMQIFYALLVDFILNFYKHSLQFIFETILIDYTCVINLKMIQRYSYKIVRVVTFTKKQTAKGEGV